MPTLTFKVTPHEAARIRELARREGVTVSEFLRRRATAAQAAPSATGYSIVRDPVTGLPAMKAPEGIGPVTSAQIRALLADFP
jgi:hypothetical protein